MANSLFFICAATVCLITFFLTGYTAQALYEVLNQTPYFQWTWPVILLAALIVFPLIASVLSLPFHSFIKPGLMPRMLSDRRYFLRRIYGILWTMVFYSGPLYWAICSFAPFKFLVFKLFGLKGNTDFVVYPDAWIRDLPVLNLSKNSYIANKATIGTNLCLQDQKVIVDQITFQENAMVGHLAVVGPGVKLGEGSQLGVVSVMGIRAQLKNKAVTAGNAGLNHGCVIGAGATVGASAYIGVRSQIGAGVIVPPFAFVADGIQILTQEEMNAHQKNEQHELRAMRLQTKSSIAGMSLQTPVNAAEVIQIHPKAQSGD